MKRHFTPFRKKKKKEASIMKRGLAIGLQRFALNENVIAGGMVQAESTQRSRSGVSSDSRAKAND